MNVRGRENNPFWEGEDDVEQRQIGEVGCTYREL